LGAAAKFGRSGKKKNKKQGEEGKRDGIPTLCGEKISEEEREGISLSAPEEKRVNSLRKRRNEARVGKDGEESRKVKTRSWS